MTVIKGTKQKEETFALIVGEWDKCAIDDEFTIVQPNDLGGKSLEKKLLKIFPNATSQSYDKARHITIIKTDDVSDDTKMTLDEWRSYGELRFVDDIGFYSMPGIFGWNKIDKGSMILCDHIENLSGIGADFGCGYGYLTRHILNNFPDVEKLYAFDIDERSVKACQKNVNDPRAIIDVADCSKSISDLPKLDFIIMNPPFHDGAIEDKDLGKRFIQNAKNHLKKNGKLFMVANTHLPYEKVLNELFQSVECIFEGKVYKIFKT